MSCENCIFRVKNVLSVSSKYFYCTAKNISLFKELENCQYFIPRNIPCALCGKPSSFIVYLDNGEQEFICTECEKNVKYDFSKGVIDFSIVDRTLVNRIIQIWDKRLKKQEIFSKLTKKELDTYNYIKTCGGKFLLRSLSPSQVGCLGKLIKYDLITIDSIKLGTQSFKVAIIKEVI